MCGVWPCAEATGLTSVREVGQEKADSAEMLGLDMTQAPTHHSNV